MIKSKKWKGLLFILPSFIGVMLFYIYPFISSLKYCFTMGGIDRKFVGISNFISLFHNEAYQLAVKNTFLIIGLAVPILCMVALILALVIEKYFKKYSFLQGWLLLPLAIPAASLLLVWKDLFSQGGILDTCLKTNCDYLNCQYTPFIIIGMILWKNIGYDVLLILSSLLMLPKEYEEAARLEGANELQVACGIKLPQLVPMLFFTVTISLFNGFKISREVYLLGGEYPHKSIYLLQHYMSNNFFHLNYEKLTTAAFMLYIVIFTIIYVGTRWQQHYTENSL